MRLSDLLQAVIVEASASRPDADPTTPGELVSAFKTALPRLDLLQTPSVLSSDDPRNWAVYLAEEVVAAAEGVGRVASRFSDALDLDLLVAATRFESDYYVSFLRVLPELVRVPQPPAHEISFYHSFIPVEAAGPRDTFLQTLQALYAAYTALACGAPMPDVYRWDVISASLWGSSRTETTSAKGES